MTYSSVPVMGYHVFGGRVEEISPADDPIVINTLNAYSYVTAEKDPEFKQALQSSDLLVADGFPVVIAARLLGGFRIKKIAGEDVFKHLLQYLQSVSGSCFFLGSTETTLEKISRRLAVDFPKIRMASFSPPFRDRYTPEENSKMVSIINSFEPTVVFVGMTAPKQEKWVYNNHNLIRAKAICSIGAVFDFYAGTVKRPSRFWISIKMEWFIRFIREPKRLGRRYFVHTPKFLLYFLSFVWKKLWSGLT